MAEKHIVHGETRNKESQLVIPLDEVRTYDYQCTTFTSGTYTSGYVCASGKSAYLRQLVVTELSGTEGRVWLADEAGVCITPPINITENTTVAYDPNELLGPITSGIRIYNEELWGRAVLVVQIDPQAIE